MKKVKLIREVANVTPTIKVGDIFVVRRQTASGVYAIPIEKYGHNDREYFLYHAEVENVDQ